uniref:TOG domain-containing protein n=2 Tax=Aegilops tauschii TaxID=37682 RepID=A0A453AVZ1_AEGTS
ENVPETESRSAQEVSIREQNSCALRCWQRISEFWSIPDEELLTDHDLLPVLAMSIIDSLAGCGRDNCVEISKVDDLLPKIIRFTRFRSDTVNNEAQQKIMLKSSLKVLQRLTSIGGKIGITLRSKISEDPFLLSNLAEILGNNKSSQESRKLVVGILRNMAIDEKTRQEIGRIEMIITKLMQAFLNAEGTRSTNADPLSRKVAGQALAMLTTECVQNCLVLMKEPEFIKKLKPMILIHDGTYIYVAASLLRNVCLHARSKLRDSDLKELSRTLREVWERIMDAEGA